MTSNLAAVQSGFAALSVRPLPIDRPIAFSQLQAHSAVVLTNHATLAQRIGHRHFSAPENTGEWQQQYSLLPRDQAQSIPSAPSRFSLAGRPYLLFACPPTAKIAGLYFDAMLRENISIVVSLMESSERRAKTFVNFWTSANSPKIISAEGWQFTTDQPETLIASGSSPQSISKSTITATKAGEKPREFTHLHLDGWRDGTHVTDPSILFRLLERIEALQEQRRASSQNDCVAIHCYAGLNRTGFVALQLHQRHVIRNMMIFDSIDIAQQVVDFRVRREGFMHQASLQIAQSYEFAYTYYKEQLQDGDRVKKLYEFLKNLARYVQKVAHVLILEYTGFNATHCLPTPSNDAAFTAHAAETALAMSALKFSDSFPRLVLDIEHHALFSSLSKLPEYAVISQLRKQFELIPVPGNAPFNTAAPHLFVDLSDKDLFLELPPASLSSGSSDDDDDEAAAAAATCFPHYKYSAERIALYDSLLSSSQQPDKKTIFYREGSNVSVAACLFLLQAVRKTMQQSATKTANLPLHLCCFIQIFNLPIASGETLFNLYRNSSLFMNQAASTK